LYHLQARGDQRPRPLPPTGINHVCAYDFVFDTCADGRMLKCLTVIDEFTRESSQRIICPSKDTIEYRLKRLRDHFGEERLEDISAADVEEDKKLSGSAVSLLRIVF
jgi:hypothetical protein